METLSLRIERHDGAHSLDEPAIPADWTVEELTSRAVPRLRYPETDVGSGKPLRYSMLHDGAELRRDSTLGEVLPAKGARVHVVHDHLNARRGR
jgi:hypothetical protein